MDIWRIVVFSIAFLLFVAGLHEIVRLARGTYVARKKGEPTPIQRENAERKARGEWVSMFGIPLHNKKTGGVNWKGFFVLCAVSATCVGIMALCAD
jgi:hypothetical protein